MEKVFKGLFRTSLLISVLFLLIGLFLLLKPTLTLALISYAIGGTILIAGITSIYKYIQNKQIEGSMFECIYGVVTIIAGLVIVLNPEAIASIIPIILGVWLIINGLIKIKYSVGINSKNSKITSFIIAVIILIGGIIILLNPFKGAIVITSLIGIYLVVYAILDIINAIILRKNVKNLVDVTNI